MAITERAQRAHDALFPGHVSTLKLTDPELVEIFDSWAFDEVLEAAPLDVKTRLTVQLAAIVACQAVNEYRVMLGAALEVGVTPVEVKEIVYQAVPYLGMARAFDFLHATNDILRSRGIELPLPAQSTTTPSIRYKRGLKAQRRILGARIDQMHAQAPRDEAHIQRFLTANCFGDHVARSGLDLKIRELVTFSMLAALGGCEAQLAGHVAANLAVGNDRPVLLATLTQLLPFIGYPRTLNALRVLDEGAPPASAP
jgi:4-carboxymuconolactone decarboxylase